MLLWMLGCTEYDLETVLREDAFEQRADAQVDWLVVVDDSGSMAPHQARLAEHFDTLVGELVRLGVDVHLGVTTTDMAAQGGRLVGGVIDPTVFGAADRFAEAVQVSVEGSGLEMGVEASLAAVTEPNRSGANAGFLRPDASLAVLYVSDEDDVSPQPVGPSLDALRDAIAPRRRDAVTAHAWVVEDPEACNDPAFVGSIGRRYLNLAERTGGTVVDLCAPTLGTPLARLSREVAGVHDRFPLSGWPTPGSLTVSIDQVETPCGEGYRTRTRPDGVVELVFDPAPPIWTTIVARYAPARAPVEVPCAP